MQDKLVEFLRKRDYILVKELGQGACGKTVLLHDDILNEYFVCKKYSPFSEAHRQELFANFVREIKLLHEVYHQSVVRVFNYYLYPDQLAGYILMEYVSGHDIEGYLRQAPEKANEIFLQTLQGFRYLEANNILHRDIRPQNVMVRDDGAVKIIDLGFGKRIRQTTDFDKSISLNWWCEPPAEFRNSVYDFKTEVYFVGKLFEKLIQELGLDCFEYKGVLSRMCNRNPDSRVASFQDVEKEIQSSRFVEIRFSQSEKAQYRNFSHYLVTHVTKIQSNAQYIDNIERVQSQLEDAYRGFMLEEIVPDAASVSRCFLGGSYYYRKAGFPVEAVRDFLSLLKSTGPEKQRIILANLHTKLDSVDRYSFEPTEDDIPF